MDDLADSMLAPLLVFAPLLLLTLTACNGGVEAGLGSAGTGPERTRSLLEERPSRVLATTDQRVVQEFEGWGTAARRGWAQGAQKLAGEHFAMNAAPRAELWLQATGPQDREVQVVARSKDGRGRVDVLLNEHLLGTIELHARLESFDFVAPAVMWERGANVLAVQATDSAMEAADAWGVRAVHIEPEERFDAETASLDPGVSASWDMLPASAGLIDLEARTKGAGELLVEAQHLQPGDARVLFSRTLTRESDGRFRLRRPLPASDGAPIRLSLTWAAATGEPPVELERLVLYEDEPRERPPVLFISVDTLAAQNMSIFGYERETTPRLAERLGDFVTFDKARSNSPWTAPSYASQFSGLYVSSVRLSDEQRKAEQVPFGVGEYRIPEDRVTLAELFAGRGYRTAAFLDNRFLLSLSGFRQGFDRFDTEAALVDLADHSMGAEYVFAKALEFMTADQARPPFVFAQVLDVHGPYFPMEPYRGTFSSGLDRAQEEQVPVTQRQGFYFGEAPEYIARARFEELPESVPRELLRADYDEKVLEIDDRIGVLLDDLAAAGLYDDALIVISADHGEAHGDHGAYFRHGLVYESQIHVPLLVKLPGQVRGGARVDGPVQLVDLLPTLADIIGTPLAGPHHGRSLLPLLLDLPGARAESPVTLSEASTFDHRTLVDGRWKLIEWNPTSGSVASVLSSHHAQREVYSVAPDVFLDLVGEPPVVPGGRMAAALEALAETNPKLAFELGQQVRSMGPRYELYDIQADPFEQRDLAAEHPELVDTLRVRLHAELDRAVADRRHGEGRVLELSDEAKAQLEALGYVAE